MRCIYCGEEISHKEAYYYFPKTMNGFPAELSEDFLVEEEDEVYQKFHSDNSLGRLLGTRGAMRVVKSRSELEALERAEPIFDIRINEKTAVINTPTIKGVTGFRICPSCGIVSPEEILDGKQVLHIGLLASKYAGKTAFLYAMTANNFKNIRSRQLQFRFIQDDWLDLGHREFLEKLKEFESGIVHKSTEKGFCYPVAVEVKNIRTNETLILVFYDVAGELLQDREAAADTRLSYFSRLDVLFLLVDPAQIFEGIESDDSQSDIIELINKLKRTLKIRKSGAPEPLDTCLIITKADKVTAMPPMMWQPYCRNPQNTAIGYDEPYPPDWELMRKFRLLYCQELEPVVQLLNADSELFSAIRRYMVSAISTDGFYSEEAKATVRDLSLQPLYLKGPLYETLLKYMEV